jgi:hypothetical protein
MNFLKRLLGKSCSHQFSWPRLYTDGHHYQTCSRCGISYEYDWNTMQLTGRVLVASISDRPNPSILGEVPARRIPLGK